MKFAYFLAILLAGLMNVSARAMNFLPSLAQLSADSAGRNVLPTRFIHDQFTQKYKPVYYHLGLSILDKEEISDHDKQLVAQNVISQALANDAEQTVSIKDLNPFLDVLAHDLVKKELAPSKLLAHKPVPLLDNTITRFLLDLAITDQQKRALYQPMRIALLRSLIPLYTNHPRVMESVKRSLFDNTYGLVEENEGWRVFNKEIEAIEPFDQEISNIRDDCMLGTVSGILPVCLDISLNVLVSIMLTNALKKHVIAFEKVPYLKLFLLLCKPSFDFESKDPASLFRCVPLVAFFSCLLPLMFNINQINGKRLVRSFAFGLLGLFVANKLWEVGLNAVLNYHSIVMPPGDATAEEVAKMLSAS